MQAHFTLFSICVASKRTKEKIVSEDIFHSMIGLVL